MTSRTGDTSDMRILWGLALIAGGFFFLMQSFGLFEWLWKFVWVAVFAAGGLNFLYIFLQQTKERWWAAIPGCTLLGLSLIVLINAVGPGWLESFIGPFFLFAIAAGFLLVYLVTPEHWWALIPGGVMTTLATVAGVELLGVSGIASGSIFFLGLGLTFLALVLLPHSEQKNLRWAWIPAGILLLLGGLLGTPFMVIPGMLWPLALIAAGGYLIWRQLVEQKQ